MNKSAIRQLVAQDKIKETLKQFSDYIVPEDDDEIVNSIIGLRSRLAKIEKEKQIGSISFEDEQLELAKIRDSFLSLLNSFEEPNNNKNTDIETIFQSLHIDKEANLGLLQMVNSNRIPPIRKFKRNYSTLTDANRPFQFYFLSGCPTEMPNSLAARIAYEIIEDESLVLDKSVNYHYDEDNFKKIKIEPLPISDANVQASKRKFKEYIQKRFSLANTQSFESFIETGLPKLLYSHVLTVFRITEERWECSEDLLDYLQWIFNIFQTAHPNVPTFIFLFVLDIKNLYDEKKLNLLKFALSNKLSNFVKKIIPLISNGIIN